MVHYALLVLTLLLPLAALFYSYKYIYHNKREPKRAILFAAIFGFSIAFIEFLIIKPSIGKVFSFFDTYFFVYFLSEEPEHLQTLSTGQNILVILFSSISKALAFAVGLKILYVNLYKFGRSRRLAGKHRTEFGFLDEPIDYIIYSIAFFVGIALFENLSHFRHNSGFDMDKLIAIVYLLAYQIIASLASIVWLRKKILNQNLSVIDFISSENARIQKRYLFNWFSHIELISFLTTFIILIPLKIVLGFSGMIPILSLLALEILLLSSILKKVIKLSRFNFHLKP